MNRRNRINHRFSSVDPVQDRFSGFLVFWAVLRLVWTGWQAGSRSDRLNQLVRSGFHYLAIYHIPDTSTHCMCGYITVCTIFYFNLGTRIGYGWIHLRCGLFQNNVILGWELRVIFVIFFPATLWYWICESYNDIDTVRVYFSYSCLDLVMLNDFNICSFLLWYVLLSQWTSFYVICYA